MRDYCEKPSAHLQASPNHKNVIARNYHIILAGNFRWGSNFMDDQSYHFVGLILMDACTHTHYNQAYFVGLIFAVRCHENCENWTPQKFPITRYIISHMHARSAVLVYT